MEEECEEDTEEARTLALRRGMSRLFIILIAVLSIFLLEELNVIHREVSYDWILRCRLSRLGTVEAFST